MAVLVTGGTGYIGSHTVVELLQEDYSVVILDNLCNSSPVVLARIEAITGKRPAFYRADLRDASAVRAVFEKEPIDSIIHFAGLKAVGESVEKPLLYYQNNIGGTLTLCDIMRDYPVKRFVFSSSATVYGEPAVVPIPEDCPTGGLTNPYGRTKLMLEQILTDIRQAEASFSLTLLRYFNPIGAHPSGLIGEDPRGIPNNLLPYIARVAVGRLEKLGVFGNTYPTPDGTGIRDYIHVMDLARGHLLALNKMQKEAPGTKVYNLGTGHGYSVLEVLQAFEKACGKSLPYEIKPKRAGDVAACYADPSLAEKELGWKATRDLAQMCEDAWRWQKNNPNGYESAP